ncbi:MAG: hypothetical protein ACI4M3_04185 [Acutalibacteraceae bacterium]
MTEEQKIDKDELRGIMRDMDSLSYLVSEITDGYFEKYNAENKHDQFWIIWDYNRNRAKMTAIEELLFLCTQEMERLGVEVYK